MDQVKNSDIIKIHLTAKLANGIIYETSKKHQPLEFRVGSGQILPGIEKGVLGMKTGEIRSIEVEPEEAYGLRREDLVTVIYKDILPDGIQPHIGQRLKIDRPELKFRDFSIVDMDERTITLDANHPLAGYKLFVDLELVEVKSQDN